VVQYLDLADFLLIAESVLGVPADVLALVANLHLADSALNAPAASYAGTELYTTPHEKAAVLCHRLIQNHPLIDGNKRVGYVAMREFVERNGWSWNDCANDETLKMIWAIAAGTKGQPDLIEWVRRRMEVDVK
jgi:death-on-curing protein